MYQKCFFKSHVALDRNLGPGYDTLLLRLIPGDLLDSLVAQSNSYPNACVPSREAVCTIFMMVFGITWTGMNP